MGVVAVGDSLLDTERSWAHWLGRAMGLPLHKVAVAGSTSSDVLGQLPELDGHKYAVGCVTVGANDVLFEWDVDRFADRLATIVTAVGDVAGRVVVPTLPPRLSWFPASGSVLRRRVLQANEVIRGSGALVFPGDLRGPRFMSADRIHPTITGQVVLADRAARLLGVTPLPSTLDHEVRPVARREYYAVGADQVPRRLGKRVLGLPAHRPRPSGD